MIDLDNRIESKATEYAKEYDGYSDNKYKGFKKGVDYIFKSLKSGVIPLKSLANPIAELKGDEGKCIVFFNDGNQAIWRAENIAQTDISWGGVTHFLPIGGDNENL